MYITNISFMVIHILLVSLIKTTVVNAEDLYNTTQLLQKIPDLYKMDDFYKCPEPASFCNGVMKLIPDDPNSDIWKLLEDLSRTRFRLNRTILMRTMCIPAKFKDDTAKKLFIVNKSDEELKPYNLSSKIFRFSCMKPRDYKINSKPYLYYHGTCSRIIIAVYCCLMLVATFYDEIMHDRSNPSTFGKWLVSFSVTSINKSTISKTEDYKKLKCMQGIRTYQTILVIFGHIVLNLNQKHIKNDEYVERMFSKNVWQFSLVAGMWVLQTYFLMSTWLITYQVLSLHKKTGRFTIRDALLLFIHRVLRIWPTLLVQLYIAMPYFYSSSYGPGNYEILNLIFNACSSNWWVTFVFATNFLNNIETCHPGMWSLSIDTQYYVLTLIFLYIVLNYELNIKKSLAVLFITSYIVNLIQAYYLELSMGSLVNVKHSTHFNFFLNDKVAYTYYGFWVNSGASIIGLLFGYLYFCHNNKKIERYESSYCNSIVFITVPVLTILAGSRDYSQWVSTVIEPLFRPLFTIGIAAGIYGMSRNIIHGVFKNVCEYKYAVALGNFSFCTYVFHFMVVFRRGYLNSKAIEMDIYTYLWPLLQDMPASFIFGIIGTLTIEIPCVKIKNLILPPIIPKGKSDYLTKNNDDCKNKQY